MTKYKFDIKTIIDTDYHYIEKIINEQFKNDNHKENYELPPTEERGSGKGEIWRVSLKKEKIDNYEKKQ